MLQKWQLPNFINTLGETIAKIEKNKYKSLENGETFINTLNKHILYRVEFINSLGTPQAFYDILKPTESLTKTNPLNKVNLYI
jgi:hypothetical protein